ncbi:MAG: phosphoenolpyruvate--protein phosphotransferase [Elusimicrobia bacterium]|nr:phosphoenolpyruvate--protein phosphotransferase [Elusimicrobiota bacterium]
MNKPKLTDNPQNIILSGVAASAGIAAGKVYLFEGDEISLVKHDISPTEVENEIKRFEEAVVKTNHDLEEMQIKLNTVLGKKYAKIAKAHILILKDPVMKTGVVKKIKKALVNTEYALSEVLKEILATFDAIDDEYFKERKHDVEDVAKRILLNLLGKQKNRLPDFKDEVIIVAHNLTPADTITMRETPVQAFVTDVGGKTSHTAIVAQSLEIPAVVGLKNITSQIKNGQYIIVDGNKGDVILNPDEATLAEYESKREKYLTARSRLDDIKGLPATTRDGHSVCICANIDAPEDVAGVLSHGSSCVGLYRSEFLYFNRSIPPTENEHYESYSKVVKALSPYEVVIRTMDVGGDKMAKLGFVDIEKELNPFMGLRAIRLCLKYPEMFISQLRGILRASAYGNAKIMYPMISSLSELRAANALLEKAKQSLRDEGIKFNEGIHVGTMIEVPSAAVIVDDIAKEVDFLSIGTNDLIQYTLAVDRVNEQVADLYNPAHPAIVKLLKNIIDAGHKYNKPVSMCGEMAGDTDYTLFLLGLGLDEFSVSAGQILKVKQIIRNADYAQAKKIADEILNAPDEQAISDILQKNKISE